ncbi:MAG: YbaB/EbfC family nucleoid-associated protein [Candidatus Staskawiczbacteria bacterium]|nr:YbaB/EbfC family nucleoid-associated protein [Candidatus Staskawiczbacteria bacterium]
MVFDQLKKINELRKLQDSFKKEKTIVERDGILVEMNGNFEVTGVKLNPTLDTEKQQKLLKECLNEAREIIQKQMAKTLMASGISF